MHLLARLRRGANPPAIILIVLVVTVWLAGGAVRGDLMGQVVVRAAAWACLVALVLLGPRPVMTRAGIVIAFVAACGLVAAMQLIPLPPGWWAALPGRSAYAEADAIIGGPAPWRPLSIVPSLTVNALGSLIVPLVAALLAADARNIDERLLLRVLVYMVLATMVLGLVQFAGVPLYIPIINGGDEISGNFANKNHFALVMAIGLVIVPVWAFDAQRPAGWRVLFTAALIPLLALAILVSGSRAGMALGVVALSVAGVLTRRPLRRALRRYPRWVLPAAIGGIVAALGLLLLISFVADRAVSINRALALDPSQDMRRSGLPTVWAIAHEYFPIGTGLGSFDTIFRQHEPFSLLKLTYFNRAHDDFLEVVLDAGLPGLLLLLSAVGWWAAATWRAWRRSADTEKVLPQVGSTLLLLVMVASIVDYPARTPMVMVMIVIAATWLAGERPMAKSALPATGKHL